jgi:hypothetical protein
MMKRFRGTKGTSMAKDEGEGRGERGEDMVQQRPVLQIG